MPQAHGPLLTLLSALLGCFCCAKPAPDSAAAANDDVTGRSRGAGRAGAMPERTFELGSGASLVIMQGDITKVKADAIVNAANERMLGGGGVDGAIHRAAGGELLRACEAVPEVSPGVRCPTGEARITPGFKLPAKHVIHTVGPIYYSSKEAAPLLASAYRSSMALANEHGLASIAFPAISCGVYGYPYGEAANVSLTTIRQHLGGIKEVCFVLFQDDLYRTYVAAAETLVAAAAAVEAATAAAAQAQVQGQGEAETAAAGAQADAQAGAAATDAQADGQAEAVAADAQVDAQAGAHAQADAGVGQCAAADGSGGDTKEA